MSARSHPGAYIAQIIGGQQDGDKFIRDINECSAPDKLYEQITSISHDQAKLRGFLRAIEKRLQRVANVR